MAAGKSGKDASDPEGISIPTDGLTSAARRAEELPAWEQIETGRFMPRRIRGSYRGRELG
jgi:hypothetical protein